MIAEDQALLRQGIVRLLGDAGFEVVAEAGDAPDLLRKVAAHKPDVAIVDVQMPPDNTDDGLRAAMEIRASQPDVGVLVLSQYAEERYAVDLIGSDAAGVGYLLKDRVTDFKLFADAVRRVAAGGSVLDPTVVAHMLGRRRRDDPLEALTPREREVLELMAEGRSNKGIAEVLVVTPHAVEKHVTSIFTKLGVATGPRTTAACSRCCASSEGNPRADERPLAARRGRPRACRRARRRGPEPAQPAPAARRPRRRRRRRARRSPRSRSRAARRRRRASRRAYLATLVSASATTK